MSKVLVVDDEPDVRLMLRMALQMAAHDVAEAECGQAAVDLLNEADYDAIVLDIHLPDISGWDVLKRIRNSPTRGATPVVIVTADVSQGSPGRIEEVDDTYSSLMYKPMDPEALVSQIDEALRP